MPKVGGEIISYCTKCKLDLNHVIHAMVGELPVRVECFTCHSTHKYHEPKEAKAAAKAAKVLTSVKPVNRPANGASTRSSSSSETSFDTPRNRKAPPIDPAETWANLLKGRTNAAKSYDMTASFDVGDVVEHPSFGMGVVEKRLEPQKISVVFRDGAKNLVDNR
jgi:hypothetical protein